jgi:NtrC-family two-component system sensor histidine kinase KinB
MDRRYRFFFIYLASSLAVLAVLVWLTVMAPPEPRQILPAFLFCALIVFTHTFGVRLPAGVVSLLPMATAAAFVVMGSVPAGWAALVGTLIYGGVRAVWGKRLEMPPSPDRVQFFSLLLVNVTMLTGSILAGGAVFYLLGGTTPLESVTFSNILPLLALGLTDLGVNHALASLVIATRGQEAVRGYLRSLPIILFYEGAPLIFAPLVALIYTQLGLLPFGSFALLLIVASLITRSLAFTSRRLERRVKELDSLQAVGQALSASLNLDTILSAIHTQVGALMDADNFYVALYDPETNEVSFPLAYENAEHVTWHSRRTGTGLTEHVLQTRQPLLIQEDVGAILDDIGIEQIGQLAESWLGVPILAEQEPIGVIALQSYSTPNAYDISHQEVLATIAAQAAVAIQNARLYEHTDEALERRVQELASILRTTSEGVMLFDLEWRVLAANRALTDYVGVPQLELVGHPLAAPGPDGEQPYSALIGFTPAELKRACEALTHEDSLHRQTIIPPGAPDRHVERTLTPVRDRQGEITGWLLVLRDITEEVELTQLREDMMHMLVHDLRSPLTVLHGSLEMTDMFIEDGDLEEIRLLGQMARRSCDRMLRMVNELLDISKLESGELPIHPEKTNAESLLREVAARIAPLADNANITIDLIIEADLPPLQVDAKFVDRVLHNLLDNGVKFTPDGGHVQLWAKRDPENADALLLGVKDTGPGIPPGEQHRLFEKFQQIRSVSGRRAGTGLGLPFCKLAIEAHGGQIWVESEVGKGSTFIMRLPAAKSET